VFNRRQVRPTLNRDWFSRSWVMVKRSSFGRSGSVASANEDSDSSPFEVFSQGNSKVSAILVTFRFAAEGREEHRGPRTQICLEFVWLCR
jgi:hypothetical protein